MTQILTRLFFYLFFGWTCVAISISVSEGVRASDNPSSVVAGMINMTGSEMYLDKATYQVDEATYQVQVEETTHSVEEPTHLDSLDTPSSSQLIYDTGGALSAEQKSFDVTYYGLDLRIDPEQKTIGGMVDVHARIVERTSAIELALDPGMQIQSVRNLQNDNACSINRKPRSKRFTVEATCFREEGELVSGDVIKVEIAYGGTPREAPYPPWDGGIVWDSTAAGKPWVGAATQTNGAWIWWPNKDHNSDRPDSVRIRLTVPEELVAASNGILESVEPVESTDDGWKTWNWFTSYPVSTYNITLNVAPYETIEDRYESITGEVIPVTFWVLPEKVDAGKEILPQFMDHLRFFEQLLGPYPFPSEKYGIVHTPYLGMEHQSIIAYGATFQNDNMFAVPVGYDDLHHHELAHEWWGNMVYAADWKDFWIHEGFGTYMQALYSEYLFGKESYKELMSYLRDRIISEAPMVPQQPVSMVELDGGGRGGDVYYKGAWVLHTLRFVVGDQHFFRILREFLYPGLQYGGFLTTDIHEATDSTSSLSGLSQSQVQKSSLPLHQTSLPPLPAGSGHIRSVDSAEFKATAEQVFGQDLDWFFDVYLHQAELPLLVVSRMGGILNITWDVAGESAFPMPLEVSFDGEVVVIVPENNRITLEVEDGVEVILDPNRRILNEFQLRQL